MKMKNDPFRMPADMTDVDELKAHIRSLEAEIDQRTEPKEHPWWAHRWHTYPFPETTLYGVSAVGGVILCALAAGHAATLLAHLGVTDPYATFWIWVLHFAVVITAWATYLRRSWVASEAAEKTKVDAIRRSGFWITRSHGYHEVHRETGGKLYYCTLKKTLAAAVRYINEEAKSQ